MSPLEQRCGIAEHCGWTSILIPLDGPPKGFRDRDGMSKVLPDYLSDLNAMHEAEKRLTYEQAEEYYDWLDRLTKQENRERENPFPWCFTRIHAASDQKAEAFLRTIGKWEGGPQ